MDIKQMQKELIAYVRDQKGATSETEVMLEINKLGHNCPDSVFNVLKAYYGMLNEKASMPAPAHAEGAVKVSDQCDRKAMLNEVKAWIVNKYGITDPNAIDEKIRHIAWDVKEDSNVMIMYNLDEEIDKAYSVMCDDLGRKYPEWLGQVTKSPQAIFNHFKDRLASYGGKDLDRAAVAGAICELSIHCPKSLVETKKITSIPVKAYEYYVSLRSGTGLRAAFRRAMNYWSHTNYIKADLVRYMEELTGCTVKADDPLAFRPLAELCPDDVVRLHNWSINDPEDIFRMARSTMWLNKVFEKTPKLDTAGIDDSALRKELQGYVAYKYALFDAEAIEEKIKEMASYCPPAIAADMELTTDIQKAYRTMNIEISTDGDPRPATTSEAPKPASDPIYPADDELLKSIEKVQQSKIPPAGPPKEVEPYIPIHHKVDGFGSPLAEWTSKMIEADKDLPEEKMFAYIVQYLAVLYNEYNPSVLEGLITKYASKFPKVWAPRLVDYKNPTNVKAYYIALAEEAGIIKVE